MDFTQFVPREIIPSLMWLGHRDWLDYGFSSSFERRTIWARPHELFISPDERKKRPAEFWEQVEHIVDHASKDIVTSFLSLALSKGIAGGPKVFQPKFEDCEALENTACNFTFEDYKQPYPVVFIEFPREYRIKLAQMWGIPKGPSHVIVYHDSDKNFITVSAFFDIGNVICHIIPGRPEYESIEHAITLNNLSEPDAVNDFKVAELAQRLAINFCMVMVLLGVRQTGPLDPEDYTKAKSMSKKKDQRKAEMGQKLLNASMYKIDFINQRVKLYEEEFLQPRKQYEASGEHHASPKPHWRRGHYRQQPYGPLMKERKLIFIKPVMVRANFFTGTTQNTEVVYQITNKT